MEKLLTKIFKGRNFISNLIEKSLKKEIKIQKRILELEGMSSQNLFHYLISYTTSTLVLEIEKNTPNNGIPH
jgi:hypothetical protein